MEDRITTIIEEGRYNGLPSHIVAEQVLEYTKSIEKENFFKTPEQKQATDIIENANEELLKELKKQLL